MQMIVDCCGGHFACQEKFIVANDSRLLRWTLCILRKIDSGVNSELLRWMHWMSREIDIRVLLYKSYIPRLPPRLPKP